MSRAILLFMLFMSIVCFSAPLRIFCTIAPQLEPIQAVVEGTGATVRAVIPPGASPETYTVDAKTLRELTKCDLFMTIGAPNEAVLLTKLHLGAANKVVKDGRRGMVLRQFAPPSKGEDPHVWLSIPNMITFTRNVSDALSEMDAANGELYRKNAQRYILQLEELDREAQKKLAHVRGKCCLTYHPAFGYFFEHYGIACKSIECEGREPSGGYLNQLLQQCRDEKIPVLFVQPQFNARTAKALAGQLNGCRIVVLDPLPTSLIPGIRAIVDAVSTSYVK